MKATAIPSDSKHPTRTGEVISRHDMIFPTNDFACSGRPFSGKIIYGQNH